MGDAGGRGALAASGDIARSAERRLPGLHQPALPRRPLPRCRVTTATWPQRTADLGLGASPDARSLGRECGGRRKHCLGRLPGGRPPHHPPNSTGPPGEQQGRWLGRGTSSSCTSTFPGRVPKERVGSCRRRAHRTEGTWARARHQGAVRIPSSPRSRQRPQRRQRRALCGGEDGPGPPHGAQRAILLGTLASVTTAAQCPAPPQLARKGATSCFVSFLFFLLLQEKWWEALLGYVFAPAAASVPPAEPRAPARLLSFIRSLVVTPVSPPAPWAPCTFELLGSAVKTVRIPVHRDLPADRDR